MESEAQGPQADRGGGEKTPRADAERQGKENSGQTHAQGPDRIDPARISEPPLHRPSECHYQGRGDQCGRNRNHVQGQIPNSG